MDGDAAADVDAELLDDADMPNSGAEPASGVTGSDSKLPMSSVDRRRASDDRSGIDTDRAGGSWRGAGRPSSYSSASCGCEWLRRGRSGLPRTAMRRPGRLSSGSSTSSVGARAARAVSAGEGREWGSVILGERPDLESDATRRHAAVPLDAPPVQADIDHGVGSRCWTRSMRRHVRQRCARLSAIRTRGSHAQANVARRRRAPGQRTKAIRSASPIGTASRGAPQPPRRAREPMHERDGCGRAPNNENWLRGNWRVGSARPMSQLLVLQTSDRVSRRRDCAATTAGTSDADRSRSPSLALASDLRRCARLGLAAPRTLRQSTRRNACVGGRTRSARITRVALARDCWAGVRSDG